MRELRECWNCKNTTFYQLKNGWLKCKVCRKRMSVTNGTYLDNLKIGMDKMLEIVTMVCDKPTVTIRAIGDKVGVAYNTAYYKKRLITSAIVATGCRDAEVIFNRLFTTVNLDENKIAPIITNLKNLTNEEVIEIRKLSKIGVKGAELAKVFNVDSSGIYKIINGKLYSSVV